MCGINGFNFSDRERLDAMVKATAHRGPDETRVWECPQASLGHNRLAIIDLSENASQPMWDTERRFVIVFNGEIYNYLELRQELESLYPFRSQSDTEVILAAYRAWGASCVNRLNGIFAFAIWDSKENEWFLARDHVGIKPLYYFWDGARFIFSSEMKAILAHDVPRDIDRDAFNLYMQLLYVPEPYTMLRSVRQLPAASTMRLREGKSPEITRYWYPDTTPLSLSRNAAVVEIRDTFRDAVRRQLISDRPVGVFLSGGIDSSAVLGAVVKERGNGVKTFSVGFSESREPDKFNADMMLARRTAQYFATDHHELMIGPEDIKTSLQDIALHLDEPNANPTAGAIFLLSRLAKEHVAVVLGGDGADELFGGYPRYYFSRWISFFQTLPHAVQSLALGALNVSCMQRVADKLRLPPDARRIVAFLGTKHDILSRILQKDVYAPTRAFDYFSETFGDELPKYRGDFERWFMSVDRRSWLMNESLLRTDTMTMAHGLEERVPILDYRLVEMANRMPTTWKINLLRNTPAQFRGKEIWIDAVRDLIPPYLLHEKKRGWFTPMSRWIRGSLRTTVEETLFSGSPAIDQFLAKDELQKLWRAHLDVKEYHANTIWAVVMWVLWYDAFVRDR